MFPAYRLLSAPSPLAAIVHLGIAHAVPMRHQGRSLRTLLHVPRTTPWSDSLQRPVQVLFG
jgi:hypothetical protein